MSPCSPNWSIRTILAIGAASVVPAAFSPPAGANPPVQQAAQPPAPEKEISSQDSKAPVKPLLAEKEQAFAQALRGAVLDGTWQMTGEGGLGAKESLTEPKTERYTITEASKVVDDQWRIHARIEVGDKDVTIPVPVRVLWAGDTPIIYVDRLPVPTMGTYSARVMIFRDFYSGTWVSDEKDYGGVMAGRVIRGGMPSPTNDSHAPAQPPSK